MVMTTFVAILLWKLYNSQFYLYCPVVNTVRVTFRANHAEAEKHTSTRAHFLLSMVENISTIVRIKCTTLHILSHSVATSVRYMIYRTRMLV